jgi:uncharacterized protein YggU (UPF0235/DUF167 family)
LHSDTCWTAVTGGIRIAVKVQPSSRRPGLRGIVPANDSPRLGIAVTEPPEAGRATRAACSLLAEALGVPTSAVQLIAGAGSREKLLLVTGDPATLAARLGTL